MTDVYLTGSDAAAVLLLGRRDGSGRPLGLELRRVERATVDDNVVEEMAGVLDAPDGVSLSSTGNALMAPAVERLCSDMDEVPADLGRACSEAHEPQHALAELELSTLETLLSRVEHDAVLYEQGVRDLDEAEAQASAAIAAFVRHSDLEDARNIESQEKLETLIDALGVRQRVELAADHIMRTDWWRLEVVR